MNFIKSDKSILSWLWKVSGKSKIALAALIFVRIILSIIAVFSAWILRELIDSACAQEEQACLFFSFAFISIILGGILFNNLNRRLKEKTCSLIENSLKQRLFGALLSTQVHCVHKHHSGEWMNRLTNDTTIVSNGLAEIIPGVCGMISQLFGALFLLLLLIPNLGFILAVFGIFLLFSSTIFRKKMKSLHRLVQEADDSLRIFLTEQLANLVIIHAFSREKAVCNQAIKHMDKHKNARLERNSFSNFAYTGFDLAMNGFYAFGAIWCVWNILQGKVSYGTFIAVIQLINQAQSPFANITGFIPRYYSVLASTERLMEIEYFPKDSSFEPIPLQTIHHYYEREFSAVEMKDLSFEYEDTNPDTSNNYVHVLDGFNLTIRKGEQVALTGPSGRGKSTVIKLLMGLYKPKQGNIVLIDNDNSQQILDSRWRNLFAYVPQGNDLFVGTIRQNVTFSETNDSSDDDKIWKALHAACADIFVNELADGLDTQLGENGSGLSEGQAQRIAIARAIYSDRPILLLDECTSSLDLPTEHMILDNLHTLDNRTILIITHRPAPLNTSDQVISF